MAERLNKRQADSARSLIQTQRTLQELQKHVFGERDMSSTQIRAAEVLLNKSLPNLQAVDLNADVQADVNVVIGSFIEPADD